MRQLEKISGDAENAKTEKNNCQIRILCHILPSNDSLQKPENARFVICDTKMSTKNCHKCPALPNKKISSRLLCEKLPQTLPVAQGCIRTPF